MGLVDPYVEDNGLVDVDLVEFCALSKENTEVDHVGGSEMRMMY